MRIRDKIHWEYIKEVHVDRRIIVDQSLYIMHMAYVLQGHKLTKYMWSKL